ncbi:hypothetical protein AB0M32_42625 [Streptomyces sp. NPDC051985]|uniref:hypothetical protein n=1 Tax=Streptomyces sp. NPDC051985 TaxID=3155807 RepID=UPI003443A213
MNLEVPADAPERAVRELPVPAPAHEHYELSPEDARAPEEQMTGPRGGFRSAQERRGPGRVFHTTGRPRSAVRTLLKQEAT